MPQKHLWSAKCYCKGETIILIYLSAPPFVGFCGAEVVMRLAPLELQLVLEMFATK